MSTSISLVGSLLEAVSEVGADPALLTGLPGVGKRDQLGAGGRLPLAWLEERAFEITGDQALGLRLGERESGRSFGVVGQLAASCRSLRERIETALAYYPLVLDGPRPELRVEGGRSMLVYANSAGSSRSLRLWTEFGMARFAQFGKLLASSQGEIEAWFSYPRPSYGDDYSRVFGANVRFNMPHNAFVFPTRLLEEVRPHWDPALHTLFEAEAKRALERLAPGPMRQRARAVLSSLRLGERPEMATVAAVLGMTERALRRRLAAEGVSFRELVDDVQRDRALILAKDPRRSAEAVSNALGFSEVSAFHRAFKRWTGLTPLQYRTAHQPSVEASGEPSLALQQQAC